MLIGAQMMGAARGSCPLDVLSGVANAAYGLRRLRAAYTGKCIRVRRSSDNTEIDVGFVGNSLDTVTLLAFTGSGKGYVTTLYDQSGNSYDAYQPTAAYQPLIVIAGVLQTQNGRPAIYFPTNCFLALPAGVGPASGGSFSVNAVFNMSAVGPYPIWCLGQHATNDIYLALNSTRGNAGNILYARFSSSGYGGGTVNSGNIYNTLLIQTLDYVAGTGANGYLDGVAGSATIPALQTNVYTYGSINGLSSGPTTAGNAWGLPYVSEFLVFNSAVISAFDRQIIEHNQENYFGIAGA